MQIVIFGAPGVGKGTQAKIISEKFNIKHVSTGDILRTAVTDETEMGVKAKKYMDDGDLVPDDIMGGLVKEVLTNNDRKNGFILDGYPRSLEQIDIFENILTELGIDKILIIKLKADEDVIVDRLTNRMQCSNCNSIVSLNIIESEKICPVCKHENTLHKRKDDEEAVVRKRLRVYSETTKPVIEYYAGKVPIIFIEATKSIDDVTSEIIAAINQHF